MICIPHPNSQSADPNPVHGHRDCIPRSDRLGELAVAGRRRPLGGRKISTHALLAKSDWLHL